MFTKRLLTCLGIVALTTCPFRKSYPDVLMMQSGQDWDGDNDTGPLDCSMQGRGSRSCGCLQLHSRQWRASAIDLPEHDVERADDRRDIGQHMPAAQEIHRLQM